jgi:hypothetical protein
VRASRQFGIVAAFTASLVTAAPAPILAGDPAPASAKQTPTRDVRLDAAGGLSGRLVTSEGEPVAGVPILLHFNEQTIAEARTGLDGSYRFDGLRGGLHTITTPNQLIACRLWTNEAAPPQAQDQIVLSQSAIRGNGAGGAGIVGVSALILAGAALGIGLYALDQAKDDDIGSL